MFCVKLRITGENCSTFNCRSIMAAPGIAYQQRMTTAVQTGGTILLQLKKKEFKGAEAT